MLQNLHSTLIKYKDRDILDNGTGEVKNLHSTLIKYKAF